MSVATILIVDDKPTNREFLATLLGYHGHRLLQAADGAAALEQVRSEHPNLVITDVLMPTMDGYEFVRQLRADTSIGDTPVIFYTAEYHEEEARRLAQTYGVSEVLAKPAEIDAIVRAVNAALKLTPGTARQSTTGPFDQEEHLRLLTDRLAHKVSELERVNEQLKASEERLKLAVDVAQTGIWDWDLLTGRITWAYHTARLFGMKPDEFDGTYQAFERCVHPDDREGVALTWNHSLTSGRAYYKEYRLLRPDGTIRWVESKGKPFFDEAGQIVRMVGTVVDITDRVHANELARRQQSELAHLSRISTMGQMASGLAHELNQPLGAILNYSGVCLDMLREGDYSAATLADSLQEIIHETKRAGEIIRRMRSFVTKQAPKPTAIDINALIKEAIGLLALELRHTGVRHRLELASHLPAVAGDAIQIVQVLVNLIQNATHAMSGIEGRERNLIVRTSVAAPSGVLISVIDSGCGIDVENRDRIFDAFFTTKPEGLGMGLVISRSIVESHGGHLVVVANADHGVAFQFTLPLADGSPEHPP